MRVFVLLLAVLLIAGFVRGSETSTCVRVKILCDLCSKTVTLDGWEVLYDTENGWTGSVLKAKANEIVFGDGTRQTRAYDGPSSGIWELDPTAPELTIRDRFEVLRAGYFRVNSSGEIAGIESTGLTNAFDSLFKTNAEGEVTTRTLGEL